MIHKYPVGIPKSLPLTVPFTIKPNSIYGVHVKYWSFIYIPILGSIIVASVLVSEYALFLLIPLVITLAFIFWLIGHNKKNSLTLTKDALTYVKNDVSETIPLSDLAKVEWGLMFAGTRLFYVLYVKNKTGTINWRISVLWRWNSRELRTIYTSVPERYRGAQDVQPFKADAFTTRK